MYGGPFVCSEFGNGTTGCSGECCFSVMYVEWLIFVCFRLLRYFFVFYS